MAKEFNYEKATETQLVDRLDEFAAREGDAYAEAIRSAARLVTIWHDGGEGLSLTEAADKAFGVYEKAGGRQSRPEFSNNARGLHWLGHDESKVKGVTTAKQFARMNGKSEEEQARVRASLARRKNPVTQKQASALAQGKRVDGDETPSTRVAAVDVVACVEALESVTPECLAAVADRLQELAVQAEIARDMLLEQENADAVAAGRGKVAA